MRIVVDARVPAGTDKPCEFLKEVFYPLAEEHKEHQFVFLCDRQNNPGLIFPANASAVIITPQPSNIFLHKWWYYVKVPFSLKKYKADIFVGNAGVVSSTSTPQVLIVHELDCNNSNTFFNKHINPKSLKKATAIASPSDFLAEAIMAKYEIARDKIRTTGRGADQLFTPVKWELREEIKERSAEGCEYFFFPAGFGVNSNLINTLKAFSIFKKWQKSNMKLIIVGGMHKAQAEQLKTYKYRNELKIIEDASKQELARLTRAAYAVLLSSFCDGFTTRVLEAIKCEVPVITSPNTGMAEVAGDAALYANPDNPVEIAEQMKRIFKDEVLRFKLAENGKQRAKLYSWQKTRALTWQLIEETVSK